MKIKTENLSSTSVQLSCHFNASPDRVFEAWTNPKQMTKWFHPDSTTYCHEADVDARLGGKFRIILTTKSGPIAALGEYLIFDRPNQLQMSWQWDFEGAEGFVSRLNIDIKPADSGSDFTLTHDRFVDEEARDNHQKGWSGCIEALATFFETPIQ